MIRFNINGLKSLVVSQWSPKFGETRQVLYGETRPSSR